MAPDTATLIAAILNSGYMVRHYARGGRWSQQSAIAAFRRAAISKMGLTVRNAFNCSDDFEALLTAVVDGLRPRDDPPF